MKTHLLHAVERLGISNKCIRLRFAIFVGMSSRDGRFGSTAGDYR